MSPFRPARLFALLPLAVAAPAAAAQSDTVPLPAPTAEVRGGLMHVGSEAEDRLRVAQLLGQAGTEGFLLRSPSSLSGPVAPGRRGVALEWVAPAVRARWNSEIPFSPNASGLWAGRGFSYAVTAGLRAQAGPVTLTLAPQLAWAANDAFGLAPGSVRDSTVLRPAWRRGPLSADVPVRLGYDSFRRVDLGQSSLVLRAGPVATGLATESQWWGPGVRNAIVMSNNAPGIPHFFLRTDRPLRTRLGALEARWMVGTLTESLYFDDDGSNDLRSLSALAVAFTPAAEPNLTVGAARAVYSAGGGLRRAASGSLDVLTRWIPRDSAERGDSFGQVFSLFGRWTFPSEGLEAYVEWARQQPPGSLRALLLAPNHTQGYTLGVQWAKPVADSAGLVRMQTELTYLEQSATFRSRTAPTFYASAPVPQGYTQRGQVIGAAIGPGGSSQWLAADYLAPAWRLGAFAQRIRWDNDAYYSLPVGTREHAHDVSLIFGARGGVRTRWGDLGLEVQHEGRRNFLFQSTAVRFGGEGAVDVSNLSAALTFTPRP